jgi:hypothetical protein
MNMMIHEHHIGEVIAHDYHRPVWMVPKINEPANIKSPDYFVDEIGNSYDLKTIKGSGKKTLKDAVKKKKGQSSKFIIDIEQ